jgi:RNA polymerase sigma-70 factor (ECF subfamily)
MSDTEHQDRLSNISTCWALLVDAHRGEGSCVTVAQAALMQRYGGAVFRYLLGVLHDANDAEELSQEFALRFLRGAFKRADPQHGRFRNYVKTVLAHLLADHYRRRQGQPRPLPADSGAVPAAAVAGTDPEQEFVQRWREVLLERTWEALAAASERAGTLYYTVLRWRAENPQAPAATLIAELSQRLGKPVNEVSIRQTLHRARERFADLLLDEVARSLESTSRAELRQELIDLDLLGYCGPALDRWSPKV